MTERALSVPDTDITAALRAAGVLEEPQGSFHRAKLDGATLLLDDEPYVYNPKTDKPAIVVRLARSPIEYQAFWFDETDAAANGRESEGFCKSYFDIPEQARKFSQDGHSCEACPFYPFNREAPKRCQWKGDVEFQQVFDWGEPDKQRLGDELWTLTLSTTGMIEFKGTGKEPVRGSVSDMNFYHRLARYALDNGMSVPDALTALAQGRVIAEVRILRASSKDGARTWSVVSFTPVAILDLANTPALTAGTDDGDLDDLPF